MKICRFNDDRLGVIVDGTIRDVTAAQDEIRAAHSFVSKEDALDVIAGCALGLDMTVRGPEDRSPRKSCDGYAVLGPWFVTADEIGEFKIGITV